MSVRDELEPIETASREALHALQLERLKHTLRRAYERVPHYRQKFDAAGVHPGDLKELSDLAKFPFTAKDDLRQNYPFGMFAVPMADIVRVHASSGTTGKSTVVGYTHGDIDTWSQLMARSIRAAGGRSTDKIHVAYGYGLFTGGLGFHYGAEYLGAAVIPVGGGFTERQVQLIVDFRPDIIVVTPSYMLAIADEFERQGFQAARLQPAHRHVRRRALDRQHARGNRAPHGLAGARSLRAFGTDRPRRGAGMPGQPRWADDLGGSFPSGNHRPQQRTR